VGVGEWVPYDHVAGLLGDENRGDESSRHCPEVEKSVFQELFSLILTNCRLD